MDFCCAKCTIKRLQYSAIADFRRRLWKMSRVNGTIVLPDNGDYKKEWKYEKV